MDEPLGISDSLLFSGIPSDILSPVNAHNSDLLRDPLFDSQVPMERENEIKHMPISSALTAEYFLGQQALDNELNGDSVTVIYKVSRHVGGNFDLHDCTDNKLMVGVRERFRSLGAYFSVFEVSGNHEEVCWRNVFSGAKYLDIPREDSV